MCLRFLCLVLAVLFASCRRPDQSSEYDAHIGIAIRLPDRVCMAIRNSTLPPSTTITLIAPADAGKSMLVHSARAQVAARDAAACPGTKDDAEISNYNLEITNGSVEENLPLVALDARLPSVRAAHSFRACSSADVIHLTAWDGAKPPEGHRLWHQTYYLGQGLETDCTAAETAGY
jgi:hypothetical protein